MRFSKHDNPAAIGHNSSKPMNDHDTQWAVLNITAAWFAAAVAKACDTVTHMTLAEWVQLAALVFTVAQTFFLLRDKWWRDRKQRKASRRVQNDRSNAR